MSNLNALLFKALSQRQELFDLDIPREPKQLCKWLAAQNLPQLENETPPASFYELLDDGADVKLLRSMAGKLLISVSSQTGQRLWKPTSSMATQTEDYNKNTTLNDSSSSSSSSGMESSASELAKDKKKAPAKHSVWALLKSLLVLISLLHGAYYFYQLLLRSLIFQHLPAPAPLPLPPRSLGLRSQIVDKLWTLSGQLARKLRLI